MIATIILGLFSVLFAYLAKYKNTQWGLKFSFTLIFLFLALRYNFGNDYKTYLDAFIEISKYDDISLYDNIQGFEIGWVYSNWLFRPFGFFAMTAVLALFNCVVYYHFIKKYVPVRYYWLAIFIYIFYPEFMLIHSSAMRQSIAIMLFLFSLDYLYKKDAIRYFLCVGFASLFHFSAIILFPVYLLGISNWKINKISGIILVATFVSLFVSLSLYPDALLSPYMKQFINIYFEKYATYEDAGVLSTGLGYLYALAMLILILYFERLQNRENALVFKLAIIGFILMPLNMLIVLFGRLGMYFAPATLIAYPIIFKNLKRPPIKVMYLTILLVFISYKFFQFFYSDIYKDYYGTYQTIFSAQQWY